MSSSRPLAVTAFLFVVVATLFDVRSAASASPTQIVLGDCLVIEQVGRYGRSTTHIDPIEAAIVAGRWQAPHAGEAVARAQGGTRSWRTAKAKAGVLEHASLQGGYAFWSVQAPAARVMVLEASGHTVAYANGEPRAGDPYQNGSVRLPVQLHAGANEFLFLCTRGRLEAKLVDPAGAAELDVRDATVPDYREGEKETPAAALVIVNASDKPLGGLSLQARLAGSDPVRTAVDTVLPLATRKAGFHLPSYPGAAGESVDVEIELYENGRQTRLAATKLKVRVRKKGQSYRRTFVSDIDGSTQYFAVQPAVPAAVGNSSERKQPALVLTLHGAGVEAIGQADAYRPKPWCHIVAPTNRRPYGFDWEEWGRIDAMEVFDLARNELHTDPRRTYLTGHSMGGHGTWQVGVTYPDRFAAVAPSAGWISFATYAGAPRPAQPTPVQQMLQRAGSAGDTLSLLHNLARDGIYVLHGDADDNVPVTEARAMRKQLGTFHADFVYYERPGAGHWWGNECVDWPPLFDFLERHTQPAIEDVRHVDFITASPRVSPRCDWLEVEQQAHSLQKSHVVLALDPKRREFHGNTDNVTRLSLDSAVLPAGQAVSIELDGEKLSDLPWPAKGERLHLVRENQKWAVGRPPSAALKGVHRYGPFRDAFRNRMLFVYGTKGNAAENGWSFAKARYDAESFWYRGNGSVEVRADFDFDAAKESDRNVILYGHAESNAAWKTLLGASPVQVSRGSVRVGDREWKGEDLACLFLRPRPDSDRGLVGIVSGSGLPGLRLTERVPYFLSGVALPDCIVLGADSLTRGDDGIRAAGFFGNDWTVPAGDWIWQPAAK